LVNYDSLSEAEQAVVRARSSEQFDAAIATLDCASEFEAIGSVLLSELDEAS